MIRKPFQFVATVALLLLLSSCGLLNDGPGEQGGGTATPTLADIAVLGDDLARCRADAVVLEGTIWLESRVPDDEVSALENFISASPSVSNHRYIDAEETYRGFEDYFADEPEILDLVTPDQLPTSFEVVFADDGNTASMVAELEAFDIVDSVGLDPDQSVCLAEATALQEACHQPPRELEVTLDLQAGDEAIAVISAAIERSSIVADFRYIDTEETMRIFEEYWADDPDIIELVDPETLPTTFAVNLTDELLASDDWEPQIDKLSTELSALNGVNAVTNGLSDLSEACWEASASDTVRQILDDVN